MSSNVIAVAREVGVNRLLHGRPDPGLVVIGAPTRLHLGCGTKIRPGFVNADCVLRGGVDAVFDFDIIPWPFHDNTFDYVLCEHCLEHLQSLSRTMQEVYRICRGGAVVDIEVPYSVNYLWMGDSTHRNVFTYNTFDSWEYGKCAERNHMGMSMRWVIEYRRIVFTGDAHASQRIANAMINPIINRFHHAYERYWSHIIPAILIRYKLRAVKDGA